MKGKPICLECRRERTDGEKDYHPMQALSGQPCGWYSGDDGEICGPCMDNLLGRSNE